MNVIKIGTRTLIYILCVAALIISVLVRRVEVNKERAAIPISYIGEIEKYGKPVTVVTIRPSVFEIKEKFTVVPVNEKQFEGYVTRKIASSLKEGQIINALNGHSGKAGSIVYVSPEVDMMSGLYRVEIEFDEPVICKKGKLLVESGIGEEKDIIEVSNDALYSEQGRFYLWKVADGKAHKTEVVLSARGGYSSIVNKGLNKDDVIVITGQSRLEEGDRVRIINTKNDKYMEK